MTADTMNVPGNAPGNAPSPRSDTTPLMRVENLKMHFPIHAGIFRRQVGTIKAVDGITFDIKRGETLGLVGESGCGKSTAGRVMLRLYDATEGKILLDGVDIAPFKGERLRKMRPRMQMVFQDPHASLNPRMTVGSIIAEPLDEHGLLKGAEREERVEELLDAVGLNPAFANRYPHEFSGGQRQRISIARALASNPQFIVCDEPTSALDVSVQAQVLNLLKQLQRDLQLTYLFISHDMAVVRVMAHRIGVLKDGRLVEENAAGPLIESPQDPYTRMLMESTPRFAGGV